ncbi:Clp protease N-terminal domain-containing protein [Streptomyces sp. NPDC048282]|uniref:Clp protease N-terminal domain-containing protein n=1 Tax=Streptomyces sp. NPDC048282 TaxID=3365528 RepID=UPI003716E4A3
MYERFSERSHLVVDRAHEEARALRHWYVEPGHVLLALLREDQLEGLPDAPFGAVRAELATALGKGTAEPGDFLPLTGETSAVFEVAAVEADRLGHRLVQPFHILLALLAGANTVVADVLSAHRTDPSAHRTDPSPPRRSLVGPLARTLLDSLTGAPAAGPPPGPEIPAARAVPPPDHDPYVWAMS